MGEALELLRFMALSASVHADALQCLIDDTSSAMTQMNLDLERLEALERQLSTKREEQRRLHAMRDLVNRSRADRSVGCGSVVSNSSRGRGSSSRFRSAENSSKKHGLSYPENVSCAAPFSNIERVLRFASSAVERKEIALPTTRNFEKTCVTNTALVDGRGDEGAAWKEMTVDEEVERLRADLWSQESMSIKAKLRELETLKQKVKNIDADAIIARYVEPFHFSKDVEELWCDKALLRSSNIDLFITRGCQRLSGRYEDSLSAIRDFPMSERSDALRVFGSLRYAKTLTSTHNYDTAAVQALQELDRMSLVQFYRKKKDSATVSSLVGRRQMNTVLGANEFVFLPEDWWSTQALCTPLSVHLPPARHILTARFSFADMKEFKALQTLRVNFQREVLHAFIRMPIVLEELWGKTRTKSVEEAGEQDTSVSMLRLLPGEADAGSRVWTTVSRCTSTT